MRRLLVASIAGGALLLGAGLSAGLLLTRKGPPLDAPVTLTVHPGERVAEVADAAAAAGVLRHPRLFTWWARLSRRDRQMRWGDFRITEPLSPIELLARLGGTPDPVHQITIPEGFTVRQILATLEANGLGAADTFQRVLDDPTFRTVEGIPPQGPEGYLFPDTYNVPPGTPPERILHLMRERFRDVVDEAFAQRATAAGLTVHEAVTLASLIEEETGHVDERRLVAAVFTNRLRRGMPLQSDPTVIYGRPTDDRTITRADLQRPTPHNTYVIRGLPPTPIANPGRASLEAAVDPAPVQYLYFVARGDGSHHFSATLSEHNVAVQKFQRRGH